MAQVRKYQRGGQTPEKKPRIFKWAGVGDYNVDDIQSTYAREVNNYINSLDLSDEERAKVRDESYRILQATMNGTINSRDASGAWAVPTGYESTGINEKERKGFLGIKGKDYVRDNDFYRNLGYGVMDKVLRNTALYTPTTVAPKKSTFKNTYQKYLTDYYFNSPEAQFNKELWDYTVAPGNLKARLQEYRKLVEDSDLLDADKSDELSRIDEGLASFDTNDANKIAYALARIGFDARQWLDPNFILSPEERAKIEAEQKAKAEENKVEEAKTNQIVDKWSRDSNLIDYYDQNTGNTYYGITKATGSGNSLFYPQIKVDSSGVQSNYDIPFFADNIFVSWDPSKKETYTKENIDRITDLINTKKYTDKQSVWDQILKAIETGLFEQYNPNNIIDYSKTSNKPWYDIYQQGGSITPNRREELLNIAKSKNLYTGNSSEQKKIVEKRETPRTSDERLPFKGEFNKYDIARLGGLAVDLGSLVTGMTGFTPASTITGLVGTGANFIADLEDGFQWSDAGRAAANLGLDVVSLVPGLGIASSGSKVAKNLIKWAPRLLAAWGTAEAYAPAKASLTKAINDGITSLTVEDLRNLSGGIAAITGVGVGAKNTYKSVQLRNQAKTGKHFVETNKGEVKLSDSQLKELKSKKGLEEQNKYLKSIVGDDYELITKFGGAWWNPTRHFNDPRTRLEYDFNKTKTVQTSKGPLEVPIAYTNNEKYLASVANAEKYIPSSLLPKWLTNIPGYYNSFKYRKLIKPSSASNSTKENSNGSPSRLALMEKNPIVTPYSTNNNKRGFREDKTDHNKLHDQRNPQFDYSEPTITSRFKTAVSTENTIGYTPTTRNIPTVSWETAKKNYDVVQDLKDKRNLNEQNTKITNVENKILNKAIDAENKARERARRETAYNAWWQEVLANMERKYPKRVTPNLTEEQIKAKQNYVNWWLEALSNQARTLPKKQSKSSNTKKKSKENKGYVNKHQAGGILKAQQGTTLRDVASTANWANQIYGTDAYFNWLKSFNINNYQNFNNYQKGWNTNYLASNYNPTGTNKRGNIAYSQNVWDSQGIFNKQANGINQIIENLANTGVITRRGNSGDNAVRNFQDGYFGGQEYLRHGGMESMLTPEQVTEINKNVNPQGLEYYFDPTTKMGFLRPMQQAAKTATIDPLAGLPKEDPETPELQGNTSQEVLNELIGNNKTARGAWIDPKTKTSKQINWDNILGTARLAGTIWTNNRIAKGLKESLSPLLLDPVQLRRQVTGDLVTRNYMEKLGAEANRIGARPITSDASLQLGQQLDFNNRANEYRIKGYLADKQAIDETTAEAQKVADFNKQQRVDVANRNRAAMLGIRQAKANIEAQRKSANWAQAIAPWLMDKEMRFRENQKLNQLLDYQENQYLYGDQYEQAAKAAQSALDQAKAKYLSIEGNNETGWLTSPENEEATKIYKSAMEDAAKTYRDNILSSRKRIYNYNPFLFTYKSGGRLSYKEKSLLQRADAINKSFMNDRKLFHKMITDSQKENNKLLMSLGGLTKELIIKSMTYGG